MKSAEDHYEKAETRIKTAKKKRKEAEAKIIMAIRSAEELLIEGGSPRIGFTKDELQTMAEAMYDDLLEMKLLNPLAE